LIHQSNQNIYMKDLAKVETKELLQMYANAEVTSGCAGHYKGEQNQQLQYEYAVELEKRNIIVPKSFYEKISTKVKINVDIPEGIFNGKGSF
jgi:hypothetical protein